MNRKDSTMIAAPTQYNADAYCESNSICPTKLHGMVKLRPTVTISGEVSSIAYAQQKSETRDDALLMSTMLRMRDVGGSSKGSMPVRCRMMNPGQSSKILDNPTRPKNSGMLTFVSSPIRDFMKTV